MNIQSIIDKLNKGVKFGLFENGKKCYFQDGERVSYTDLWEALREVHLVENRSSHKTIHELCPDTYEGVFPYRYSSHNWNKKSLTK